MPIFLTEDRGLEVVRPRSRSHGGQMERLELGPRSPGSKPTQLPFLESASCLSPRLSLAWLKVLTSCISRATVSSIARCFAASFPKSPAGFSADKGTTWEAADARCCLCPGWRSMTRRLFALGGATAPAMVPSLQLKPESELTPFSVSLAWRRPKARLVSGRDGESCSQLP